MKALRQVWFKLVWFFTISPFDKVTFDDDGRFHILGSIWK